MKEMVRYGFILSLICMVAAGLLAGVNYLTNSRIIAQAQAQEEASLKEVMPEAERFAAVTSDEEIIYYQALDRRGKRIGVVFKASQKGYSSVIETMVGMLKDGSITAIKVLNQTETPGLGAKIAGEEFTAQFRTQNALSLVDIQAITGATISSKAVIDSVKQKAAEIKTLIKDDE